MKTTRPLLLVALLFWPGQNASALEMGLYDFVNVCTPTSITGQFSAAKSSYKFSGSCLLNKFRYSWTTEGSYTPIDGRVQEHLVMQGLGERGEATSSMTCGGDPWLGNTTCSNVKSAAQGRIGFSVNRHPYIELLASAVMYRLSPLTTGLAFDRSPLLATRAADLKAEAAAAKARADSRIKKSTRPLIPYHTNLSPIILAPAAGQRFLHRSPVPIKLTTPKGWTETQVSLDGTRVKTGRLYMVRIERKDPSGNWVAHTSLPVGAIAAESAAGFLEFGAGAPPGGITTPGAWRLSAQISAPMATGWSDWVEFVVMAAPSKNQLQPAPRTFSK